MIIIYLLDRVGKSQLPHTSLWLDYWKIVIRAQHFRSTRLSFHNLSFSSPLFLERGMGSKEEPVSSAILFYPRLSFKNFFKYVCFYNRTHTVAWSHIYRHCSEGFDSFIQNWSSGLNQLTVDHINLFLISFSLQMKMYNGFNDKPFKRKKREIKVLRQRRGISSRVWQKS